eukprot:2173679-Pleurochrysis_carterae.AAC.2
MAARVQYWYKRKLRYVQLLRAAPIPCVGDSTVGHNLAYCYNISPGWAVESLLGRAFKRSQW